MAIKRLTPGLATLEAVSVMGNHLNISRKIITFGEIESVKQHPQIQANCSSFHWIETSSTLIFFFVIWIHLTLEVRQSKADLIQPFWNHHSFTMHHQLLFQSFPISRNQLRGEDAREISSNHSHQFPSRITTSTIPFWNLLTGEDCYDYNQIHSPNKSSFVFSLHTITHTNPTCAEDSLFTSAHQSMPFIFYCFNMKGSDFTSE
jgi:hypothetical protein